MTFKTWCHDKKIADDQLKSKMVFLKALQNDLQLDLFYVVADQICALQPTFAEGLNVFEILTDLILMGHNETLLQNFRSFADYQNYLRSLRYPVSASRDQVLKDRFEKLPWPAGSKVKFERRGDRAGVEFKFFISSAADLTKMTAALERVKTEISE